MTENSYVCIFFQPSFFVLIIKIVDFDDTYESDLVGVGCGGNKIELHKVFAFKSAFFTVPQYLSSVKCF